MDVNDRTINSRRSKAGWSQQEDDSSLALGPEDP